MTGLEVLADATGGAVRFVCPVPAAAAEPLALARLVPALAPPARIVVRDRTATLEGTCPAAGIDAVLRALGPAWPPATQAVPPAEDLAAGVFEVVLPPLARPVFLRLAPPATALVDRARATFLLVANGALAGVTGGWVDGPGALVDLARADPGAAGAAVHLIARGLGALAEERVARSFLETNGIES